MSWLSQFKNHLQKTGEFWVDRAYESFGLLDDNERRSIMRKKELFKDRQAEIVKANTTGRILGVQSYGEVMNVRYLRHLRWIIKQNDDFYVEEEMDERHVRFQQGDLVADHVLLNETAPDVPGSIEEPEESNGMRDKGKGFHYNRLQAVRYAERWWNAHNPEYKAFDVDCTNYISQCLHAGSAPMHGQFNRTQGWWCGNGTWSFSWTVANALRWYLSSDKNRMGAVAKDRPDELVPGDVICYDFEGDGRWDHSTIVTAQDGKGMPLVNAHTTDSRHRYWSYEDSTAWTENIQYKFFHIEGK